MKILSYEDVIDTKDGKKVRKKDIKLSIDTVISNRKPYKDADDLVLSPLMEVKSSGGFRPIGKYKSEFDVKYVVLYSTNEDIYWQDRLDNESGLYTYYGDNKEAGQELHKTKNGGNLILREVFSYTVSEDINIRKKIPPFFLFEKAKNGNIKFSGLLVPGYKDINPKEWLTALWAQRKEGGRFQNYKALFTVLNIDSGSQESPNEATIDLRWLEDLKKGNGYESKYAPLAWKKYIKDSKYSPLVLKKESNVRSKNEQLPKNELETKMLKYIQEYFKDDCFLFEEFAIDITKMIDSNIVLCENTRNVKDGGRDGIGEYKILSQLSRNLRITFSLEAKCYNCNHGVGVRDTSRLISRIKHREFGVFVTTSYIQSQAYKEIIEDGHPIAIISGRDIIEILFKNDITDLQSLKKYLEKSFPKERKEEGN